MPIGFQLYKAGQHLRQKSAVVRLGSFSLVCCAIAAMTACAPQDRAAKKIEEGRKQVEQFDSSLTFQSVTLEEFDDKGRLWWKVKAKQARYSKDNKVAAIQSPDGELYQDGKPILKVKANRGEVKQDGKAILLIGNITATDLRDGVVFKGNEVEWQPERDLLIVRNNLTGTHPQLTVKAKEARMLTRARQIDLTGQVVATATKDKTQMKSEKLTWLVPVQKLQASQPLQVVRVKDNFTDQARSNKGLVDLKTRTATLQESAQIQLGESGLQVLSNALLWNFDQQTIASNVGVTVLNPSQQLTLTAIQGQMNMKTNMAELTKNVRGTGGKNQAQIAADRLLWNLKTQKFDAFGNVVYRQANPPLNLVGPQASGTLQDQMVVVSGGRVETKVIP